MSGNLRLVVVGSREFSRQVVVHLVERGWHVAAVVGPDAGDTDLGDGTASLREACRRHDIEYVPAADINDESVKRRLRAADPEFGLCCGWTEIIDESVLDIPERGFAGVHASALPEGRGGAPVNWSIIRGDDRVGVSLFRFVPEVDHGDVLERTSVPVQPRDDVSTVYDRVTVATRDLLDGTLPAVADGSIAGTEQSFADATYRPQRTPDDGLIDWGRDPVAQRNWVRALTDPYPGAFTFLDGSRLRVWRASVGERAAERGDPGEVVEVVDGAGVRVRTGGGTVLLERVQLGDGPRWWADELDERGTLSVGDVLGTPADFPEFLYTGLRDPEGGLAFERVSNVAAGERTALRAVCCSHASERTVTVEATLDGAPFRRAELDVDGWSGVDLTTPPLDGSHTLAVTFEAGDERVDRRYMKLYGADE